MADQDDMTLYTVDFEFQDILGAELGEDPNDFVTAVRFKSHTEQEEPGAHVELVGKGKLSLFHFGLAMDAEFPLRVVMDATSSILAMSEMLFSWKRVLTLSISLRSTSRRSPSSTGTSALWSSWRSCPHTAAGGSAGTH